MIYVCSRHADKNPQQHVPVQEYSENLKEISRLLTSSGVSADRVIFITPPPVHEAAWEKECILKGNTHPISFCSSCIVTQTALTPQAYNDHEYFMFFFPRMSSQSAQLCSGAVRPSVCPGCWSVWCRRPRPVDTNAERWTGGWCLSLYCTVTERPL